jgi:hypothetical protein
MHQEPRQVEKTGFIQEGRRTSATARIMLGHMDCGSLLPLFKGSLLPLFKGSLLAPKSPRHRSSLSAGANA